MKIAIVGCGLIGTKRAVAAKAIGCDIILAVDVNEQKARELGSRFGAASTQHLNDVLSSDADIVFVATSHDQLASIGCAALKSGKHVLVEKPGGRNLDDVIALRDAARASGKIAKIGYNHRFHPAILKAREIVDSGEAGPLMYVRGRYGHGGRPGYAREWRFNPEISGGGQLIDQGSHLVDLAHWFLGDLTNVGGALRTCFWDSPVEDNVFLTLSTEKGQVAWLHASWSEWKNMFSFEIYGRDAKLEINGLGGSYGVESLTYYKMLPGMGPPETTRWEWPFPDRSWDIEVENLIHAIKTGSKPIADIDSCIGSMSVISSVYADAKTVKLETAQF